jgi:hypothetical protein
VFWTPLLRHPQHFAQLAQRFDLDRVREADGFTEAASISDRPQKLPNLNSESGRDFLDAVERRVPHLPLHVRNERAMQSRLRAQQFL